ncbi:MAG TPA: kelch repeat-containing protein [Planctomycetota bacterium]|nr:kelch repeat-containing protein [Planctomycetota bacterium]
MMPSPAVVFVTCALALGAALSAQAVWTPLPPGEGLAPLLSTLTYDTGRQRLVSIATLSPFDVVEGDRSTWRRTGMSTGYGYTTIAYDRVRHVTVSFGGATLLSPEDKTFEWDGTAWTLRTLPSSPPARMRAAMAFDRQRNRMVLFGGTGTAGDLADTWEYDGNTWTQVVTTGGPSPRHSHAMVYDSSRGVTVLVGGGTSATVGETWEWDGTTWTQFASGPGVLPVLAYDEVTARCVQTSVDFQGNVTTWERVGTTWVVQQAIGPIVQVSVSTFDPVLGHVVAVAGDRAVFGVRRLWAWNGATWFPVQENDVAPNVDGMAMAFCPATKSTLQFGAGSYFLPGTDRTWEWRGGAWRVLATANHPPQLAGSAMAAEPGGTVLLFGGTNQGVAQNATWRFTGSDWQNVQPNNAPSPRSRHGMALDTARGRIVLFGGVGGGGNALGDTWEWNGTNWQQMGPSMPPSPRGNFGFAFDPTTGRTLLFGGGTLSGPVMGDFWGWNGATWSTLNLLAGPTPRGSAQMAFDTVRQRMVVTGGFAQTMFGAIAATGSYEWDGAGWSAIGGTQPQLQIGVTGVFDEVARRFVLSSPASVSSGFDFGTVMWELGSPSLAAASAVGTACSGSAGAARVSAPSLARTGNPHFVLRVASVLPGAPTLLGLAAQPAAMPLGGGCTLYLDAPQLLFGVAGVAGAADFPLPLPATPSLHGAAFECQGAALDPQGPWAALAVFSGGLHVTVD